LLSGFPAPTSAARSDRRLGTRGCSGSPPSAIGTTPRSDGKPQVTYNGHPLYLYSGDQSAGDTNGQGSTAFGGGWFALSASGDGVSAEASNSSAGGYGSADSVYGGGY
jgi:hypothetical protein